jgi:hypothetical protein
LWAADTRVIVAPRLAMVVLVMVEVPTVVG